MSRKHCEFFANAGHAILSNTAQWSSLCDLLLASAFILQCYYSWPIVSLAESLTNFKPQKIDWQTLKKIWASLERTYQGLRVVDGILCKSTDGLSPLKNPSKRQPGRTKFMAMAQEVDAWRSCCKQLARYFEETREVDIKALLDIIKEAQLSSYNGDLSYGNVRLCRILTLFAGAHFADTEANWEALKRQSASLRDKVHERDMSQFTAAEKYKDALRIALGMPGYTLNDMAIFVCLLVNPDS